MSTIARIFFWTAAAVALLLVVSACVGLGLIESLPQPDSAVFQFGDAQVTVAQLEWPHWLALGGALLLAGVVVTCVVALVLPLTLLLGVGLPLLVLAGTGAVLALPLVLPVALVVWLLRERKPAASAQ